MKLHCFVEWNNRSTPSTFDEESCLQYSFPLHYFFDDKKHSTWPSIDRYCFYNILLQETCINVKESLQKDDGGVAVEKSN